MIVRHDSHLASRKFGRLPLPPDHRVLRRQRNKWLLLLSLALGIVFCILFGCVLFCLNR